MTPPTRNHTRKATRLNARFGCTEPGRARGNGSARGRLEGRDAHGLVVTAALHDIIPHSDRMLRHLLAREGGLAAVARHAEKLSNSAARARNLRHAAD